MSPSKCIVSHNKYALLDQNGQMGTFALSVSDSYFWAVGDVYAPEFDILGL
jgi:hypothetical protein